MNRGYQKLKIKLSLLTIGLILTLVAPVFAHESSDAVAQFRSEVEGLLAHSCLIRGNYGVKIYSLDRKEVLFQHKDDQLFIPASNLKLITTALAVRYLGPNYRFYTRLYSTGKLVDGVLHGDLYIKGFGDPKLVSEQMWLLVQELKNLSLNRVEGDIIADDTYFDDRLRVKTWKKNPGAQAYNAPLGALSFNFNTVAVHVTPANRAGEKPMVIVDPAVDFIHVDNQANTVGPGGRGRLLVNRVDHGSYNEITVSGAMVQGQPRAKYYLNITDPTLYTGQVFKKFLVQSGIEVSGQMTMGAVPDGAEMLVEHESEPLALALQGLNKFSNNFVAEQILKALGAERFGPPGTTEKGLRVVEEFMTELGYSAGQYKIFDGSGLSRQNRISPDQFVNVLSSIRSDLGVYPEFITALGVMGMDGNVKNRLRGTDEAQKVRVKTGTLNFVSALSGYFQSMDGEIFAFSILMNDLKCSNGQALGIQDRIVREGLHFSRSKPNVEEARSPAVDGHP